MKIQVKDISKIYGANESKVIALNYASLTICSSVLFPLPDGPMIEIKSPSEIVSDAWFRAMTLLSFEP